MNEQIRELALQAGYNGHYATEEFDVDKFAELIVRECIELCKKQEYDYWRASEDQDFTPIDCADAIKQHFGVKE